MQYMTKYIVRELSIRTGSPNMTICLYFYNAHIMQMVSKYHLGLLRNIILLWLQKSLSGHTVHSVTLYNNDCAVIVIKVSITNVSY